MYEPLNLEFRESIVDALSSTDSLNSVQVFGADLVNSTMDVARQIASGKDFQAQEIWKGREFDLSSPVTLVFSREQTSGRGRNASTWISRRDVGLYLSLLFKPGGRLSEKAELSAVVGNGLCKAMSALGVEVELKWPNDIYVQQRGGEDWKKLAGCLVETVSRGDEVLSVVVGVGINLQKQDWPDNIPGISLEELEPVTNSYPELLILVTAEVINSCKEYFNATGS